MKNLPGQVLIELLVAMAVSAMALVGMAQIATKSLNSSTYSKNRSAANNYAVAAVEYIRDQKNIKGWTEFSAITGNICMDTLSLANTDPCKSTETVGSTIFIRNVTFDNVPGQKTVKVVVTWPDKGGTQNSTQTVIFKQY